MAVLDKVTEEKIGKKTYKLCFTLRAVINLEKQLDRKSILDTIANPPLSYNDTYQMFKFALFGGGMKDISDDEAEDIMMEYLEEHNLGDIQTLILTVLMKSGVIGKVEKNA